jgi:hypothetical protein
VTSTGDQTFQDGAVRLLGSDGCTMTFKRLRPGAMYLCIAGFDTGKLGDAPFDVLSAELARFGPLELYVDTRDATGVVTAVREAWTAWFTRHQAELKKVHILVSDRLVQSAVAVSKHFSRTGEMIRVLADPARFDELVAAA